MFVRFLYDSVANVIKLKSLSCFTFPHDDDECILLFSDESRREMDVLSLLLQACRRKISLYNVCNILLSFFDMFNKIV